MFLIVEAAAACDLCHYQKKVRCS